MGCVGIKPRQLVQVILNLSQFFSCGVGKKEDLFVLQKSPQRLKPTRTFSTAGLWIMLYHSPSNIDVWVKILLQIFFWFSYKEWKSWFYNQGAISIWSSVRCAHRQNLTFLCNWIQTKPSKNNIMYLIITLYILIFRQCLEAAIRI